MGCFAQESISCHRTNDLRKKQIQTVLHMYTVIPAKYTKTNKFKEVKIEMVDILVTVVIN